jgi:hypothetical protein
MARRMLSCLMVPGAIFACLVGLFTCGLSTVSEPPEPPVLLLTFGVTFGVVAIASLVGLWTGHRWGAALALPVGLMATAAMLFIDERLVWWTSSTHDGGMSPGVWVGVAVGTLPPMAVAVLSLWVIADWTHAPRTDRDRGRDGTDGPAPV